MRNSNEAALDTTIEIVTPENIAFHYRVAGPFRRLPALLLDYILRMMLYGALWFLGVMLWALLLWLVPPIRDLAGFLFGSGVAAMLVFGFILDWFYGGLFETYWNGQTPGKRLLGIRVVTTSGQPISALQAIMRNVFRYADLCPFLSLSMLNPILGNDVDESLPELYMIPTLLVGLVTMLLNRRFQRLGDILCGTMVIVEERKWLAGVATLEDPRAAQLAAYLPVDFVVSRPLARALALYVDRRRYFTPVRRREVAQHLGEPLVRHFGLLPDTSHDLLLCALYFRTFVADRTDARPVTVPVLPPTDYSVSPFGPPSPQHPPPTSPFFSPGSPPPAALTRTPA
ncbi:MAG: RDD family protein [Pirellulales bacterium]